MSRTMTIPPLGEFEGRDLLAVVGDPLVGWMNLMKREGKIWCVSTAKNQIGTLPDSSPHRDFFAFDFLIRSIIRPCLRYFLQSRLSVHGRAPSPTFLSPGWGVPCGVYGQHGRVRILRHHAWDKIRRVGYAQSVEYTRVLLRTSPCYSQHQFSCCLDVGLPGFVVIARTRCRSVQRVPLANLLTLDINANFKRIAIPGLNNCNVSWINALVPHFQVPSDPVSEFFL